MKLSMTQYLALISFSCGALLFLFAIFFWPTPPTPIVTAMEQTVTQVAIRGSLPTHIHIGSLIDLPIEEMAFGTKGWQVSDTAASIASSSARPNEHGNIVIYSHNLKRLFGKLSRVRIGDTITLTTQDGEEHPYTVTHTVTVTPDQIDILKPTTSEVLTLYTCTGLFDSKRFVVQAVPTKSVQN